ncbi:MAG TPA: hypothetical protein VGD67_13985 [Pseudonocardiaceae bacterium]
MARSKFRTMILVLCGLVAAAGLSAVTAGPAAAVPGLVNVSAATVVDSAVAKSATATCPAGLVVIGGGARLTIVTGEVSITRMNPTATGDGYDAYAYEDQDGYLGNWGLVVTAICANPPPGYQIVTATSVPTSNPSAQVAVACPAGTQVLGTGGAVAPGRGVVVLSAMFPTATTAPTRVQVNGSEVQGGYSGTWNLQVWAICTAPVAGHTVVSTAGVSNSASPKTTSSVCPAGSFMHGVGFQLGGSWPDLFLNGASPTPAAPVGTSVPVTVSEDQSGLVGFWAIRTVIICAS